MLNAIKYMYIEWNEIFVFISSVSFSVPVFLWAECTVFYNRDPVSGNC